MTHSFYIFLCSSFYVTSSFPGNNNFRRVVALQASSICSSAPTCRRVQSSVGDEVAPQTAAGSLGTERCLVTDFSVRLLKCAHKHTLLVYLSRFFNPIWSLQINFPKTETEFIPWQLLRLLPRITNSNLFSGCDAQSVGVYCSAVMK